MAEEPNNTSPSLSPCAAYMPPVGRLPVLGKIRAEIYKLYTSASDDINQIKNRDAAQENDDRRADAEIDALIDKTEAETGLLNQKTVTELSQTSDFIPDGIGHNTSTVVNGIVEKQKGLFQKQADGFDRDAEQKLAKIYADTWSVRQTTDGALAGEAGLAEDDVRVILDKAREGVTINPSYEDITPTPPSWTAQIDVAISTDIESNEETIAGLPLGARVAISVLNGEYSINGADYTNSVGEISSGDTLKIKVTSADTFLTAATATVIIGNVTTTFTVTTAAA